MDARSTERGTDVPDPSETAATTHTEAISMPAWDHCRLVQRPRAALTVRGVPASCGLVGLTITLVTVRDVAGAAVTVMVRICGALSARFPLSVTVTVTE